jgi:hypothetical protein
VLRVGKARSANSLNSQPRTLNQPANFSVKEKDEASPMDCFHRDSQDAFIPRFAGIEGFFISTFNFALVSQS